MNRLFVLRSVIVPIVVATAIYSGAPALSEVDTPASELRTAQVNRMFNIRASHIITMDVDPTPARPLVVRTVFEQAPVTLRLEPHSIRAAGFQVQAQRADGTLVAVDPGPVRTMRGSIDEVAGAVAAGSMMPDGLYGSAIMPDGTRWWFEPLRDRLPGAADNEYVLYRSADVLAGSGRCGNEELNPVPPGDYEPIAPGSPGAQTYCAELACDADVEYFQAWGSSVTNVQQQIERVTNQMDLQYVNDVDIDHVITQIIVRTVEPDPYTADAAIPLVTQFRDHWLANHGNIPRDAAQLFTGRPIVNGSGGYIGYAFQIGAVCTGGGYCVSQSDWGDCCNSLACATDLSAHELGHLWGAFHCSTNQISTMNPGIQCINTFLGCTPDSIQSISAYRNGASCLALCGPASMPFVEPFASQNIDAARWMNPVSCTVNSLALNEPSAPFSLDLKGQANLAASITSAAMNAAGATSVQLSFWYEQGGGGDDPGANADLVVEYLNSSGSWLELDRLPGIAPPQMMFAQRILALPADACHAFLRVRFRNESPFHGLDDWFVDDVRIIKSPANDNCSASIAVSAGTHAFTTLLATTDGPDESGGCGVGQISNDIWFRYGVACAPATVTVSLCGADYDTRLAVYAGGCPAAPGAMVMTTSAGRVHK